MSILFYRRPNYSPEAPGHINSKACQRYVERTANSPPNIPDGVSFDAILENKSLPPCTLGDFMDYLIYVAHDAENLQFFLWYKDYCVRFEALDPKDKELSGEWRNNTEDILQSADGKWPLMPSNVRTLSAKISDLDYLNRQGIDSAGEDTSDENLTALPNAKLTGGDQVEDVENEKYARFVRKSVDAHVKHTVYANEDKKTIREVEAETGAFASQPYRAEVTRVITHYFAPSAPRHLNLSSSVISQVLYALQRTTHPSAFEPAAKLIETHLRHHSHTNFVRWSTCNGNRPRVFFVRFMGILHTFLGFLVATLLTLSSVSRWWRILASLLWFIGIATLIAAFKGLCVILHMSGSRRTLKPWEDPAGLYSTFTGSIRDPGNSDIELNNAGMTGATGAATNPNSTAIKTLGKDNTTTNVLIATNNNLEKNASVEKYEKKSALHKVFEKTVVVQESAIRLIQDRIIRQAQIWALILTVILTIFFVALPSGRYY